MARPRVFVSSTYYDLKNIRVSLGAFITQMGYDAILNEGGNIPYGKSNPLDIYCYDEIQNSDIVISVIGGRYGSTSSDGTSSISQKELRTALELGKQVYIFIERDVLSEFRTFKKNRDADIRWVHVDNPTIYYFIDDLFNLPVNNAIFGFENSQSIIDILREQWAGLFQRLLMDRVLGDQVTVAQELNQGLRAVRQVIDKISGLTGASSVSLAEITAVQHPAFARLRSITNIKHRVFFISSGELEELLRASDYIQVDTVRWDDENVQEWFEKQNTESGKEHPMLLIDNRIFSASGNLLPPEQIPWSDELIRLVRYDPLEDKNFERIA